MQKQSPRGLKDQVARGLCHVKMGDQREAFPDVNPARFCAGSLIEDACHCDRKIGVLPLNPFHRLARRLEAEEHLEKPVAVAVEH